MEGNESNTEVVVATPAAVAAPSRISPATKLVTRMIDTIYSEDVYPASVTPEQKHHIRTAFVANILTKLGV